MEEVYPNLVYTSVLLCHFGKTIPLQKKQRYRSIPIVFVGILRYFRGGTAVPSAKDCSPHSKGLQYLRQGPEEVIESIQKTVYFKDIC